MRKCANISPYKGRPLVTYDFATSTEFPYIWGNLIFFLSVYHTHEEVLTDKNRSHDSIPLTSFEPCDQVIYNVNSVETGSERSSLAQVDHELTRHIHAADSEEDDQSQYRVKCRLFL